MGEASREIWLHVGLPKCGSTTVQRYFARHYAANLRQGLCYPHAYRAEQGYRNHMPLARLGPESLDAAVAEVATEAAESDRILLSCEAWGKSVSEHNLLELVEAIRRGMPDRRVRFVAFFRNIYGFVESSYAQFIKGGLFGISKNRFFHGNDREDPGRGIDRFLQLFEERRGYPLYSNLGHARDLLKHLPRETVQLRSVETVDLQQGDMLQDLCDLLKVRYRGNMPSLNQRVPDRKIAEFEFMQTIVDRQTFDRLRRKLLKQDLVPEAEAAAFRGAGLHIGPELHQRMARLAEMEQLELGELFDTRVTGLGEDRWRPEPREDRLSEADRAALQAFASRFG